jgi:hypothetical protein
VIGGIGGAGGSQYSSHGWLMAPPRAKYGRLKKAILSVSHAFLFN